MATPSKKKTVAKKLTAEPTHVTVPVELVNTVVQIISQSCHPSTPLGQVNSILQA